MSKKSQWLDRSLFISPYYYRLCLTEKEFHKELKKLKLPKNKWPRFVKTDHSDATLHTFISSEGYLCAIITIRHCDDHSRPQIYAMMVHEATHLWRYIRENVGECEPSAEFEAYAIQSLSQRLMESYEYQTKKKGRK